MAETFIVVWEGVDGAGKTTLMKRVKSLLAEKGYKVLTYKTPSDSSTGKFAKTYGNDPRIDPLTRMLLFLANTSDDSKIMKKLMEERPDYLFIDRYYLCSIVYGLAFLNLSGITVSAEEFTNLIGLIEKLGNNVFLKPHLYVIVDAPEEDRIKRLSRKESQGGLENELERDILMQQRVRRFYKVFRDRRPDHVLWVMNPEGKLEQTAEEVAGYLISESKKLR
ncbi:MAG: thymidylate kinase [Thaumarchaeota archaeon]|nr:thymidylate kinase [Nitrososphaerota archaeon]